MITQKEVRKALGSVMDPDLKKDIVTLGMVKNIRIPDAQTVHFEVELTTPACPLKELIRKNCYNALKEHLGKDTKVEINMTSRVASNERLKEMKWGIKNIIAVASGKGGVGKSTITANVAIGLARAGAKVGLIDADIFGPSIPSMFNCEYEKPGMTSENGKNFIVPILQYQVKLISIGVLTAGTDAVVWRGPMASSALRQFIFDTRWEELDYLFIDLPPGTSDIHLTMVQSVPVTAAIVVTTPQKISLIDARRGIAMFRQPRINVPILGVVENMAFFSPPDRPKSRYYLFGKDGGAKLAAETNVPLLGQIPITESICADSDLGTPSILGESEASGYFQSLCDEVAKAISVRNYQVEPSQKVEITRGA